MFPERRSDLMQMILFLAPAVGMVIFVAIFPIIYTVDTSLYEFSLVRPDVQKFVGIRHYADLLFHNPEFWNSLIVTLFITAISIVPMVGIGLLIALLLNNKFPGRGLLRVLLALPVAVAPIAVGTIWKIMYSRSFGFLNWFIGLFGVPGQLWLGEPLLAKFSIIIATVWQGTPFMMLVLLAGLQSIPAHLYEAAAIDGASALNKFFHITLPGLKDALFVAVIFQTIEVLRIFDMVYVLTRGGPGTATQVLSFFSYQYGFRHFHIGFTSAVNMLFLIIALIIFFPLVRRMTSKAAGTST